MQSKMIFDSNMKCDICNLIGFATAVLYLQ
jgi:hypothetical protein